MNDEIKTAEEIAREKISALGEATEEDKLKWEYVPEGEKLATKYLGGKLDNLEKELAGFDKKARPFLVQGIEAVLLANIDLPKNDSAKAKNEKAMAALKAIKKDGAGLSDVLDDMQRIFDHYVGQGEQQRKQNYENLKIEFKGQLQKLLEKQMGSVVGVDLNVEKLPQFQEEWRRVQAQMDRQYLSLLDEYKREIKSLK
jgi:hypothetical protein